MYYIVYNVFFFKNVVYARYKWCSNVEVRISDDIIFHFIYFYLLHFSESYLSFVHLFRIWNH